MEPAAHDTGGATMTSQMTDHASLAHFERALDAFQPPTEAFDPSGRWENAYRIVECSQGMRPIGALRISRQPAGDDAATLTVRHRKGAAGGSLHCTMRLECRADTLSTPVRWTMDSVAHNNQGKPIEDTHLVEQGEVLPAGLRIQTGQSSRTLPIRGPFAFEWGLFDAVQRLAPELPEALTFTLVDRLSYQIKPEHVLAHRRNAEVELGGKRIWAEEKRELKVGAVFAPVPRREGAILSKLRAYEHLGEGILPTVYWVNEQGRLLLVLSGLIGIIFDPDARV